MPGNRRIPVLSARYRWPGRAAADWCHQVRPTACSPSPR